MVQYFNSIFIVYLLKRFIPLTPQNPPPPTTIIFSILKNDTLYFLSVFSYLFTLWRRRVVYSRSNRLFSHKASLFLKLLPKKINKPERSSSSWRGFYKVLTPETPSISLLTENFSIYWIILLLISSFFSDQSESRIRERYNFLYFQ